MNKQHKQSGFTLIEMMVVVVVIALLGAMIGPTLFKKVQQAEETRVSQDIRTVVGALKFYRLDNYRYPTQAQGPVPVWGSGNYPSGKILAHRRPF